MLFKVLLLLIFIRPFIASLAYPYADFLLSLATIAFSVTFGLLRKTNFRNLGGLKLPLLFFFLTLCLSVIFSLNKAVSINALIHYLGYLLILLVCVNTSEQESSLLLKTLVFSAIVVSLSALYQYFFGLAHTSDYITKQKHKQPIYP